MKNISDDNNYMFIITDKRMGDRFSSECFILMEQNSGRVIAGKNIHRPKLIASVTKIMTAIIAIESKN